MKKLLLEEYEPSFYFQSNSIKVFYKEFQFFPMDFNNHYCEKPTLVCIACPERLDIFIETGVSIFGGS